MSVIIEAPSLIHARMRASLDGIDADATFAEAMRLDAERTARVPRDCLGRALSPKEAAELLHKGARGSSGSHCASGGDSSTMMIVVTETIRAMMTAHTGPTPKLDTKLWAP